MNPFRTYVYATLPALVVLGFFVWFANWIPQTRWVPPARAEIRADMTPGQLAKAGERIVRERGCLTCHTLEPGAGVKGQGRGPNLVGIAARRSQGVAGGPGNLVDYLIESLYEPGAYLVESYANIMPPSTRPPAKLDHEETVAVVNYLQSLGSNPSVRIGDVPPPTGVLEAAPASAAVATADAAAPADAPGMLAYYQCLTCHSLEPGKVLLGPALAPDGIAAAAAAQGSSPEDYLMSSILDPRAVEREGFPQGVMPDDYGPRLSARELYVMVEYLLGREGKP